MTFSKDIEKTKELLKRHKQGHLLAFSDQLGPLRIRDLVAQIQELDFSQIDRWVDRIVNSPPVSPVKRSFCPPESYPSSPLSQQQRKYALAEKLGKELISAGKVAAFTVAGGQGTRLGFDGPKGDFPISPVKKKTLFELFAESVAEFAKKYRTVLPWYIMTSQLNHKQTEQIFRSKDFFGLDEKDVFLFQQGTLPNFDFDGRILLADKDRIASSPDGHGGSLKALYKSGAIEDMEKRGIEFISYFQIDNPLVNIFDALFVGLHVLDNSQMSSKAVLKNDPAEKVGVFCLVDNKVNVIEYSDLSDEQAGKHNPDGSLVFGLGSMAVHIINRTFVEKLNDEGFSLPLHKAVKKIGHIDGSGNSVIPNKPNGIKLEMFVFDALPLAGRSTILQTRRSEEFAPVKNAAGPDSPEVARKMMVERNAQWLESAGVKIPRKPDGSPDAVIEIAAGFAVEKEDVSKKVSRIPEIKPASRIYLE